MKLQVFMDQKHREFAKKKKLLKRKAFFVKAKIFLIFILPPVIVLLAVKVIQTFVRMKIRTAASDGTEKRSAGGKKPVDQKAEKPEFVTPVPVETDGGSD